MNNVATRVGGYAPNRIVDFKNHLGKNETWLTFFAEVNSIYNVFNAMPKLLKMNNKIFIKMSHNSDNGTINYKEYDRDLIATKIK